MRYVCALQSANRLKNAVQRVDLVQVLKIVVSPSNLSLTKIVGKSCDPSARQVELEDYAHRVSNRPHTLCRWR